MKKAGLFSSAVVLILSVFSSAYALEIVQSFESSWTTDRRESGVHSYMPFDSSIGILTSVKISTHVAVSDAAAEDSVEFSLTFSTGTNPVAYQFSASELIPITDDTTIQTYREWNFTTQQELNAWIDPLYGPEGLFEFESEALTGSHSMYAITTIVFNYSPLCDPDYNGDGVIDKKDRKDAKRDFKTWKEECWSPAYQALLEQDKAANEGESEGGEEAGGGSEGENEGE